MQVFFPIFVNVLESNFLESRFGELLAHVPRF